MSKNKRLTSTQAAELLTFNDPRAREVEYHALVGVDLRFGTPTKRRNLIKLALRDGMVCSHCGIELTFEWMLPKKASKVHSATFDHIIPKSMGVLSCKSCNNMRGNMPLEEFRHKLSTGEITKLTKTERLRNQRKRRTEKRLPVRNAFLVNMAFLLLQMKKMGVDPRRCYPGEEDAG